MKGSLKKNNANPKIFFMFFNFNIITMNLNNLLGKSLSTSVSNKRVSDLGFVVKTMSNRNVIGISNPLAEAMGLAKGSYLTYHKMQNMVVGDSAITFDMENAIVATAGFSTEKTTVGNKLGVAGQWLQCSSGIAWDFLGGVVDGVREGDVKTKTTFSYKAKVAIGFSVNETEGGYIAAPIFNIEEATEVVAVFVASKDEVHITFVSKEDIASGFKFAVLEKNGEAITVDARDEDSNEIDENGEPVVVKKKRTKKSDTVSMESVDVNQVELDLDSADFDDIETEEEEDSNEEEFSI